MKKKISILLAVALVITSIFTACNTSEKTGASASPKSDNSGEASIWWNSDNLNKAVLLQAILDFTDQNPNAKINMINPTSNPQDPAVLKSAIAANTAPDIVKQDSVYVAAFGVGGNFLDLVPLGANNYKSKFYESCWNATVYKGKQYGLPFDANTICFLYNKDIFEKAGATPPTNYQGIIDAGKKINAAKIDGVTWAYTIPFTNPNYKNWASFQYYFWLWRNGGEILNADHTQATFNSDAGVQALQMVTALGNTEKIADPVEYHEADFFAGKIGMIDNGCWQIPGMTKADKAANFGVLTMPVIKDGVPGYSGLGLYSIGVLSTAKNPQLAFNFAAFLSSTNQYQLNYCKNTNLIPSIPNATGDSFYNTPEWKVFVDQLKVTKARPGVACWSDVDNAVADAIAKVATGAANAKEALDAAASTVNALLAKES